MKHALLNEFESYLSRRRRQLQDWEASPPHKVGWLIFGLVCLELILVRRLLAGEATTAPFVSQMIGTGVLLLLLVGVLTKITAEIGDYFEKKGKWKATWTFLNIGLYPLLFYLPIALTLWLMGDKGVFRLLVFLFLSVKILANWRESIEVSHEFNRWQSALVLYSAFGLLSVLLVLMMYLSFFRALSDFGGLLAT